MPSSSLPLSLSLSLTLLLLMALPPMVLAGTGETWYQRANSLACPLTGLAPAKPILDPAFCPQFSDISCCLSQHDDDFGEIYNGYVNLGQGCQQSFRAPDRDYEALRDLFCAPCDPDSYKYMLQPAAPGGPYRFAICQSFALSLWGTDGTQYNRCGLMYPTPCSVTIGGQVFPMSGDPFDCGDDLVVPSVYFSSVNSFINGVNATAAGYSFKPPVMDDIVIEIIDDINNPSADCYRSGVTENSLAVKSHVASPLLLLISLGVAVLLR